MSKILIATDGSKIAQRAGRYAVDLAKRLKALVIILSVIDRRALISQTIPSPAGSKRLRVPVEDYLREAAMEYAGRIARLCDARGVKSKIVIATGHPVEEIVKKAGQLGADLIVVGSRGESAARAVILGSVTYGVIHRDATIPVLVVKQ
ncbi:MAG: universal stress protein [bacterium]